MTKTEKNKKTVPALAVAPNPEPGAAVQWLEKYSFADRDYAHERLVELQEYFPKAECREVGGDVVEIWSGPSVPQTEEATDKVEG